MTVSIGNTTITEQEGDLMDSFWPKGNEIPKHVRITEMSRRIPLLCMNEGWEENGIPQEENGGIITYDIPISLR